ncbi:hypothetical protein [Acetobacter sp.]|uniref:hypothetical protein n=1 Tax=Acetobacter sp. TaxID=440 RepID=UPI0039EC4A3D
MSRLRKAWRVRSPWQETWQGEIIFSSTASKARYQGFLSASEYDDDLKIIDMSVKRARPDDVSLPDRHDLAASISPKALECLLHATGANEPWRVPTGSRNAFYASENDPEMIELMQYGLMENTKRGWEKGSVYFRATALGLEVAKSCEPLYQYEAAA